jgi:hypothetical protein
MSTVAGLVLALLSTAALSYGFYRQHAASGQLPALSLRHPLRSLAALFSSWRWLAGFVIGLSGWVLYIVALRFAPLSLVQATSAGGVGLLALLVRHGGGRLSRNDRAGVVAAVAGLALLGMSLPLSLPAPVRGAPIAWQLPLTWTLISVCLAAAAAGPLARRLRPGAGLGAASGLLYAAGDVATKAFVSGTHPVVLFVGLLLICHGLAFVALQLAFQRGSALATAGLSTLLTNALPIVAGLAVFAEAIPSGIPGALRGVGFAGTVLGAAMLSAGADYGNLSDDADGCDPSTGKARDTTRVAGSSSMSGVSAPRCGVVAEQSSPSSGAHRLLDKYRISVR